MSRRSSTRTTLALILATVAWTFVLEPARPAGAGGVAPTNIACLPFPEEDMVAVNGGQAAFDDLAAPYVNTPDQNTITWQDPEDETVTGYQVERQADGGEWLILADDLDADARFYTDLTPDETDNYRYRVRQLLSGGGSGPSSAVCRKPSYVMSGGSDPQFIVFYRTTDCPPIDDTWDSGRRTCTTNSATPAALLSFLEGSQQAFTDLRFQDPVVDAPMPIDVFPCNGGGCARSADGTTFLGLTPDTVDPAFDPVGGTGEQASVTIPLHELYHKVQGRYGCCGDAGAWTLEGQARSIEDKICLESDTPCVTLDQAASTWYLGEVQKYLDNPNETLTEASYRAALFWTYVTEQFGTVTDEPQRGIDFIQDFLEQYQSVPADGPATLDAILTDEGVDFEDVFAQFAVATYAKDLAGAPSTYTYLDETQAPGSYGSVTPIELDLTGGGQGVGEVDVAPYGAKYLRAAVDGTVANVDIDLTTQLADDVVFRVLLVDGGALVGEMGDVAPEYHVSIPNTGFDQVVVVVAGLANGGVVSYALNAANPEVNILDPITSRPAQAGDPATPRKILAKVQVLQPSDGTPMEGLSPADDLAISIGGVALDLTDPEVLIAQAYIQGQYWLVLRAPVQPADGDYDLSVDYAGFAEVQTDAVSYGTAVESDNVLVIDRSGSMGNEDRMPSAKDAGRLYVDSWDTGDAIGVVSFAVIEGEDPARTDLDLQPWDQDVRDDAFTAIDGLDAFGDTAIGAGLLEALADLDTDGDASHPWAEVLLSDGLDNADPRISDFLDEYNARVAAGDPVPVVHTIALGPTADRAALESLADATGGQYEYASQVGALAGPLAPGAVLYSELAEIHRVVAEVDGEEQQIYAATRSTPLPGGLETHMIRVEKGVRSATFVANWSPAGLPGFNATLLNPNGASVTPTQTDATHKLWRVPLPKAGTWLMLVNTTAGPGTYLVEASARGDVSLLGFLGLAVEDRETGRPMPIVASVSETEGIPGATVQAEVTDPLGNVYEVPLLDDGAHGDGAAGDGVYGGTFLQTFAKGSYVVVIDATGTAPIGGPFVRRARLAFNLDRAGDLDSDHCPDWWETANGTDPGRKDCSKDPDGDGLPSVSEFTGHTHPLDADTDNGGESDGTEVGAGLDPRDPEDDRVGQPRARAWAGVKKVWITHYTPTRSGVGLVLRSVGPDGPYVQVGQSLLNGSFLDRRVVNGTEYCYRVVVSMSGGAKSAPSTPECATPKTDPYAPNGFVSINDGAPSTTRRRVLITLLSSDSPKAVEFLDPSRPPIDAHVPTGVTEMRLWNPGGMDEALWVPYAPTAVWRLSPVDGLATVLVQFRDGAGNVSNVVADTIAFGP